MEVHVKRPRVPHSNNFPFLLVQLIDYFLRVIIFHSIWKKTIVYIFIQTPGTCSILENRCQTGAPARFPELPRRSSAVGWPDYHVRRIIAIPSIKFWLPSFRQILPYFRLFRVSSPLHLSHLRWILFIDSRILDWSVLFTALCSLKPYSSTMYRIADARQLLLDWVMGGCFMRLEFSSNEDNCQPVHVQSLKRECELHVCNYTSIQCKLLKVYTYE